MEPALSRIEREYVVKSMGEEKPDLLLVCGAVCRSVSSGEYSLRGDTLAVHIPLDLVSESRVRVYFAHRKRGIYFDSSVQFVLADRSSGLLIGDRMYKEPAVQRGRAFPVLYMETPVPVAVARPAEWFPTEPVFPDPVFFMERKTQIDVFADKLGLGSFQFHAARIFEYLSQISGRDEYKSEQHSEVLLIADENAIAFTMSKELLKQCKPGDELGLILEYVNRRVRYTALCSGMMAMDSQTNIVCARTASMHEEDKRFIHERVYNSRYK